MSAARPPWCPFEDCQCLQTSDTLCVGVLPRPFNHEGLLDPFRYCLDGEELFKFNLDDLWADLKLYRAVWEYARTHSVDQAQKGEIWGFDWEKPISFSLSELP